jgi:hypothetical protein
MSREVFLNLTEKFVVSQCVEENVPISTIKSLACGGTRLVCTSVADAETMRRRLSKSLMRPDSLRERHGPGFNFVART